MQDSSPLIALVIFVVLSLVFGFLTFSAYSELNEGAAPDETAASHLDYLVDQAQKEIGDVQLDIQKVQGEVQLKRSLLAYEKARYEYLDFLANDAHTGLYELALKTRVIEANAGTAFEKAAVDLGKQLKDKKDETQKQLRKDESDERDRADARAKALQAEKDASGARVGAEKQAVDRAEKEVRQRRNYEQSALDENRRQLNDLTQREVERATVLKEIDGRVILSDPVHNTIFIDLGAADGVRNGYRFECFALKPGDVKLHKAFLEVRHASANLSECLILTKPLRLPRDPVSDYVASQPEELFSPYQQASSKQGALLQGLTGEPKKVMMGMAVENPIVAGDYVQNPFFKPGRTFTFYIAGDKVITDGVQRSAIAYPWPQIQRVLEFYGCTVAKKVELGVDYVIAQRNPADDSEFNKAVTLGIPVIYEWEIFRFLDQQ